MKNVNDKEQTYDFIYSIFGEDGLKSLVGRRNFKKWFKRRRNDYLSGRSKF
jgi:hypothetical protein